MYINNTVLKDEENMNMNGIKHTCNKQTQNIMSEKHVKHRPTVGLHASNIHRPIDKNRSNTKHN